MNATLPRPAGDAVRLKLTVRGAVQGVGFRPFVHRLATELHLAGWVNNSPQGVFLEVEGPRAKLDAFLRRLKSDPPPRSSIQSLETAWLAAAGLPAFEIRPSETAGSPTAPVLPDLATCPDCLREIFDPADRHFGYPFTNCTNCGPRFSILAALPYDRANTSMKGFKMCPQCQAEYDDPSNRRFHAQPNACPVCGPALELWQPDGQAVFGGGDALRAAAQAIRRGRIVAVKGVGGFHLLVDARNDPAVRELRQRKGREEKPFALLFPSIAAARVSCEVSPLEEQLLLSTAAPIVLLKRIPHIASEIADAVASANPNLGVMLPSNPLHHLLLAELGFPVVATSGNLSDEPICTDQFEALDRLRGLADVFLVHDRPILRHLDDSIVRVMLGREMILRRARGYAPMPLEVRNSEFGIRNVLAVGAQLKNSIALAVGDQVFLSQHIGDLETVQANAAFHRVVRDFEKLYAATREAVACDLHPDYFSTGFAHRSGGRQVGVQHHLAHVLSCMADNELAPPVLGVAWDGTGCGLDGTVWGGEFFLVTDDAVGRVAHLRPFPLPGGDRAVREPRRAAIGLLYAMLGESALDQIFHAVLPERRLAAGSSRAEHAKPVKDRRSTRSPIPAACEICASGGAPLPCLSSFTKSELANLGRMLGRQINTPLCSSVGRLFDAVASLVNLRQQNRFEGQAAMELEFALEGVVTDECYALPLVQQQSALVLDWAPMIEAILADVNCGLAVGEIAARFHNALVEGIVEVARQTGRNRVVLSGGCFQNRYLTERAVTRLREEGIEAHWHHRVPPNDGGIALGQIVAIGRLLGGKDDNGARPSPGAASSGCFDVPGAANAGLPLRPAAPGDRRAPSPQSIPPSPQ